MFSANVNEENISVKNEYLYSPENSTTIVEAPQDDSRDEVSGMDGKRYALRWRHHQSTVVAEVGSLYRESALVDVTLACEDQRTYQAHKLVLSACSQYFQSLFSRHPSHQHPIIFLKDVNGDECEALLTYMYKGEVSVSQDQIPRILRVASSLQVRGLAEVETPSSQPSSPAYGDRAGNCASSSPSPSTGPPTKCATPISEPQSPTIFQPMINQMLPNSSSSMPIGHHPSSVSADNSKPPPPAIAAPLHRHPASLAAAAAAGSLIVGGRHSSLPQDFSSPYSLLPPPPRHSYDLGSKILLGPLTEERKRLEEKGLPALSNSYASSLRVKKDLGGSNDWEGGVPPVDVGGLSPISLPEAPRPTLLPPHLFNFNQQMTAATQYGRMFSISDPLRRVDRLSSSGGETRIHNCQYCSRKFKRKDHLKTHVRIHTGERPYKCKVCGRGFIQSQQVKIHMKVHVREDSSSIASSSLLGGSRPDDRGLAAIYPDLSRHYNEVHLTDPVLRPPRDHPENDGLSESPSDHNHIIHSGAQQQLDSSDEFSSEMMDQDYDSLPSTGGRFLPPASSSAFDIPTSSNPSSPPSTNRSGGGRAASPLASNQSQSMNSSPREDETCSAIVTKEPYHIAASLKK